MCTACDDDNICLSCGIGISKTKTLCEDCSEDDELEGEHSCNDDGIIDRD